MDSPPSRTPSPPHPHARQKSLSESHIQLPRTLAFVDIGYPLEEEGAAPAQYRRIRSIPSALELTSLEFPEPTGTAQPIRTFPWRKATQTVHRVALHMTFHLLLISLFETLFFWQFVSRQEDSALTGLVNTYTGRAFSVCSNLTDTQKTDLRNFLGLFLNTTTALQAATDATSSRQVFNGALLRNSWLYFGGLATIVGLLTSTALLRRIPVRWGHLVGENLGLVAFLGIYEWMFFHTVALRYEAVTPAELDGMVLTEFQGSC
jgi:hypothetical protein